LSSNSQGSNIGENSYGYCTYGGQVAYCDWLGGCSAIDRNYGEWAGESCSIQVANCIENGIWLYTNSGCSGSPVIAGGRTQCYHTNGNSKLYCDWGDECWELSATKDETCANMMSGCPDIYIGTTTTGRGIHCNGTRVGGF
jgi:hypothetical protein